MIGHFRISDGMGPHPSERAIEWVLEQAIIRDRNGNGFSVRSPFKAFCYSRRFRVPIKKRRRMPASHRSYRS